MRRRFFIYGFHRDQNCMRASLELRGNIINTPSLDFLEVAMFYDGAFQKGGTSGGGISRYCFASAISVESVKVSKL